jgi:hypothetical protein
MSFLGRVNIHSGVQYSITLFLIGAHAIASFPMCRSHVPSRRQQTACEKVSCRYPENAKYHFHLERLLLGQTALDLVCYFHSFISLSSSACDPVWKVNCFESVLRHQTQLELKCSQTTYRVSLRPRDQLWEITTPECQIDTLSHNK